MEVESKSILQLEAFFCSSWSLRWKAEPWRAVLAPELQTHPAREGHKRTGDAEGREEGRKQERIMGDS